MFFSNKHNSIDIKSSSEQLEQLNTQDRSRAKLTSSQLRRTRQLLAVFSLWRTRSEAMDLEAQTDELERARQQQTCNRTIRNSIVFAPTCASHIPYTANLVGVDMNDEAASQRRLWQTLVMPLALGSVIFLIALWTRQVNLRLVNDTMVMLIILGAIFIIMTGMAFWFAQSEQGSNSEQPEHQIHCHRHASNRCRYHRHFASLSRSDIDENLLRPQLDGTNSCKCCTVAFIDYQPPDYHSAMNDSLPVNLYLDEDVELSSFNGSEKSSKATQFELDANKLYHSDDDLSLTYQQPPSYEHLKEHNQLSDMQGGK